MKREHKAEESNDHHTKPLEANDGTMLEIDLIDLMAEIIVEIITSREYETVGMCNRLPEEK